MRTITTNRLIYDSKNDRYLIPLGMSNRYLETDLVDDTFSVLARNRSLGIVYRVPISRFRTVLFLDVELTFAQTCFPYYEIYGGFQ